MRFVKTAQLQRCITRKANFDKPAKRWQSLYNYWANQLKVGNHYTIIGQTSQKLAIIIQLLGELNARELIIDKVVVKELSTLRIRIIICVEFYCSNLRSDCRRSFFVMENECFVV
ncbi:MAG: hypothetical protein H7239_06135 [Flavobacterium sp.]|nr:hypothetical protein [Flavobacterium sp.]